MFLRSSRRKLQDSIINLSLSFSILLNPCFTSSSSHTLFHTLLLCHRGVANLLNAKEVGMKIFEDYANSWIWILM